LVVVEPLTLYPRRDKRTATGNPNQPQPNTLIVRNAASNYCR
jgi:hypothetical protein